MIMDYRALGRSGLKVSVLTLGTMTFGGKGAFAEVGTTDAAGARRMVDLCVDAGINTVDTADVYSSGLSEEIVGQAIAGKRDGLVLATKARFPMGEGPNERGLSRHHLVRACEASLKRLGTDWIDLYQLHEWDGLTPLEETLEALDLLVRSAKVRYVGASNFSGWHLMKALGISDARHLPRFVAQQIHYTLQAREVEYELVPISVDQGPGFWSGARSPAAFCRASIGAASRSPRVGCCRSGKSLRCTTRSGSMTSSRCWSRSAKRGTCRRPRWRLPGSLGARP